MKKIRFKTTFFIISAVLAFTVEFGQTQDIWRDDGEIFTDREILTPGALVSVLLEPQTELSVSVSYKDKYSKTLKTPDIKADIADFFPKMSVSKEGGGESSGEFDWEEDFQASFAGEITEYDAPSGVYKFVVRRVSVIGGSERTLLMTGAFSQHRMKPGRKILSSDINNLRLVFTDSRQEASKLFREKDFEKLLSQTATNESVENELKESVKKQMLLRLFSDFLDEIF